MPKDKEEGNIPKKKVEASQMPTEELWVDYKCRRLEFCKKLSPPCQESLEGVFDMAKPCQLNRKKRMLMCGWCKTQLIKALGEDDFWEAYEDIVDEGMVETYNDQDKWAAQDLQEALLWGAMPKKLPKKRPRPGEAASSKD